MSITSSCAECEVSMVNGVMKHRKGCTGYMFEEVGTLDYVRPPTIKLTFDTPEEQAEWFRKIGKNSGTNASRPVRKPSPSKEQLTKIIQNIVDLTAQYVSGEPIALDGEKKKTIAQIEKLLQSARIESRVYALQGVTDLIDGRTFSENTDWGLELDRVMAITNKRLEDTRAELEAHLKEKE